jgi:molecular chaperone Hsp33
MPMDDLIRPFQIGPFALRGRHVRLGAALDRIVGGHNYPDAVAELLSEAIALAALLAGALKYDGIFTFQIKGDGPIRLLVADVTSAGAVRGYAQFDTVKLESVGTGRASRPGQTRAGNTVPRLLGAGHLAFTVDQGQDTERYQGIVELIGATLADCVHHYFRQSEQIGAGIRVAATRLDTGNWRAGAIMIQRVPEEGGTTEAAEPASESGEDDWRRALTLLGSCSDAELTDPALEPDALLYRLFHEDGVRVYPAQLLEARCRCSRERIEDVLRSLPEEDLAELVVDGRIGVTCEFCSTRYSFSDDEVAALLAS